MPAVLDVLKIVPIYPHFSLLFYSLSHYNCRYPKRRQLCVPFAMMKLTEGWLFFDN